MPAATSGRRGAELLLAVGAIALALGLLEVTWWLGGRGDPAREPLSASDRTLQQAYSVALHVHGSFSEGVASIDSHSREARELGVDAIWWSDHDFRIASHRHISRFGFEDWSEPIERGEPWRNRSDRLRLQNGTKRLRQPTTENTKLSAEFVDASPREGKRSLRIWAASPGDDFEAYLAPFSSRRALERRPLGSGVTLELSIFSETIGPDGRAVVEVGLSEHTSPETGELAQYTLRYACRDGAAARRGTVYELPLACPRGTWIDHRLEVSDDAVLGFPEFPGDDNSLHELRFGVESRRGAPASARFDRLRIEQRHFGEASYAQQRELIDAVSSQHPGLQQLQGVEVSYASQHLNEFSLGTRLLDYEELLRESDRPDHTPPVEDRKAFNRFVTHRAVAEAHGRGGLVSYNHPFGTATTGGIRRDPPAALSNLIAERAYGVDLLEVGYRRRGGNTLNEHLWVWDQLALAGIRLVGIGVSDSHGGPEGRWRSSPNNFVSWIEAASPSKRDLIDGLRAGRVFFGDIVLFDGTVDLTAQDGARMGETVVTDAASAQVSISIDGLVAGDRVYIVEAAGRTAEHEVLEPRFRAEHTARLPTDTDSFVRLEVYDRDGRAKVFSNPIYFTR